MYKKIILFLLVSQSAISQNSITAQSPKSSIWNNAIEIQFGFQSITPIDNDYKARKISLAYFKNINSWSFGPQLSFVQIPENGTNAISIRTDSFDGITWARYNIQASTNFSFYGGLGLGIRQDHVKLRLANNNYSVESENYGFSSIAGGTKWYVNSHNLDLHGLMFSLEAQFCYIPSFESKEVAILFGTGIGF